MPRRPIWSHWRAVHMQEKECPLCGGMMRLVEREETQRIPGTSELNKRKNVEWVCPECDYFEEADPEGAG